jgi:hypothetical protein
MSFLKKIIAVTILLIGCNTLRVPNGPGISSTIAIPTPPAFCGGVILDTGIILTANHCVEDKEIIKFITKDDKIHIGHIICRDIIKDIAIISSNERSDVINIGTPIIGTKVIIVHHVGGCWRVERAVIMNIDNSAWNAKIDWCPPRGASGSPVYDESGNLLGILTAYIVPNETQSCGGWVELIDPTTLTC